MSPFAGYGDYPFRVSKERVTLIVMKKRPSIVRIYRKEKRGKWQSFKNGRFSDTSTLLF